VSRRFTYVSVALVAAVAFLVGTIFAGGVTRSLVSALPGGDPADNVARRAPVSRQIAGGPLLGWLALAAASTRPAMLTVAVILAPSLYLYLRTIRLHGRDLIVDEVA